MAIAFKLNEVIHPLFVRFSRTFLPTVKKRFTLRTVNQQVIDVHGIAQSASSYGIKTDPRVIEEGLSAGLEAMCYLAAEGYKIDTPLFTLITQVTGQYSGAETRPAGTAAPVPHIRPSAAFRDFLKKKVKVIILGVEDNSGEITHAGDKSGTRDTFCVIGGLLTIHGFGLKINAEAAQKNETGFFFVPEKGRPVKAESIAVNQPRTLKVLVPPALVEGVSYHIRIVTQSSAKNGAVFLKELRCLESAFQLTAVRAK